MFPISSCKTFLRGGHESNLFLPLLLFFFSLSPPVPSFTATSLHLFLLLLSSQECRLHFRVRGLLRQAEAGRQRQSRGEHRRVPAACRHRHHLPRSPRGAVPPGHAGGHRSRGKRYRYRFGFINIQHTEWVFTAILKCKNILARC